ncbi:MAG: hypothetical protein JJD98_00920 [Polaromonas sp.]|nr:hypothetical protein [Polaromonas sp.]
MANSLIALCNASINSFVTAVTGRLPVWPASQAMVRLVETGPEIQPEIQSKRYIIYSCLFPYLLVKTLFFNKN